MHGNRIFGNVCSMSDTDCTIDFNRSSVSCVQSDAGSDIFDNGSGGAYQNKKMDLEDDDRNGSGTAASFLDNLYGSWRSSGTGLLLYTIYGDESG